MDHSSSLNEPPLVLDHFKECVFEMVTFLFFVYLLKNLVNFDVFGGGPVSFLLHRSVRTHRLAKIKKVKTQILKVFSFKNCKISSCLTY